MKKYFIIIAIASVPLHCFADSDYRTQGFFAKDKDGQSRYIERTAKYNNDGSITIIPGNRPDALKEIHQHICEAYGGEDVTNESILTLHGRALDAIICDIPEAHKPASTSHEALAAPTLNIYPPNLTVNLNANFYLTGSYYYHTVLAGPYNATLSGGGCSTSDSGNLTIFSSGTRVMTVLCHAFDAGTYTTELSACIPNLCASGTGTVVVNP